MPSRRAEAGCPPLDVDEAGNLNQDNESIMGLLWGEVWPLKSNSVRRVDRCGDLTCLFFYLFFNQSYLSRLNSGGKNRIMLGCIV